MSDPSIKTGSVDVAVVGVPVTDQDRAVEFYVGKLGFETRLDAPMPSGGRWITVAPPSATTVIALVASNEQLRAGLETGIRFATTDADYIDGPFPDGNLLRVRRDGTEAWRARAWRGFSVRLELDTGREIERSFTK